MIADGAPGSASDAVPVPNPGGVEFDRWSCDFVDQLAYGLDDFTNISAIMNNPNVPLLRGDFCTPSPCSSSEFIGPMKDAMLSSAKPMTPVPDDHAVLPDPPAYYASAPSTSQGQSLHPCSRSEGTTNPTGQWLQNAITNAPGAWVPHTGLPSGTNDFCNLQSGSTPHPIGSTTEPPLALANYPHCQEAPNATNNTSATNVVPVSNLVVRPVPDQKPPNGLLQIPIASIQDVAASGGLPQGLVFLVAGGDGHASILANLPGTSTATSPSKKIEPMLSKAEDAPKEEPGTSHDHVEVKMESDRDSVEPPLPPARVYVRQNSGAKKSTKYKEKRAKNNISVRKTRAKKREEEKVKDDIIAALRSENEELKKKLRERDITIDVLKNMRHGGR